MATGCSVKIAKPDEKKADETEVETVEEQENVNVDLLTHPDRWGIYTESGGSASFDVKNNNVTVKISDPGKVGHAVQLYYEGFELLEGGRYEFSAEISSDVERTFEWRVQLNGGDYHPYVDYKDISIGPDPILFTAQFTMREASDPAPRMCFNIGDEGKEQGLSSHSVKIDNIRFVLADGSAAKKTERLEELLEININQIGYRPNDEKRAVIRNSQNGDTSFEVVDVKTNKTVYEGSVTEGASFGSSGDNVSYAVFSDYTTPGRYKIMTKNSGESYEFSIEQGVYDDALVDSLRMLYLQRCGIELPKELAGDFAHKACHTEDAKLYDGDGYLSVIGGWHDAGDYGRYTSPAAKAVADLLLAYELYPDSFGDNNNIPESGNGIPDVLDEARYELDWLLKMQTDKGGVYHKVTGLNFDGFVNPDECTEPLYILPESKTSTADFAGVMYMAARVYKDIDAGFANTCKAAADRALSYYIDHIDDRNFVNPPDVNTGEYKDGCSVDEFLWAICEGYKTTGDKQFEKKLELVDFSRIVNDDFGWEDMSGYAYYAYLSSDEPMKSDFDFKDRFFTWCDSLRDNALNKEAYGGTIMDDYAWGSNMTIANNGMAMLLANKLTGDDSYVTAAKRQLDYLFGVNSTSYCFLTGYGTKSPEHPHHRPSEAVGKCMKGMLVGGPDSGLHDPYAKAVLEGLPKARCYVDNAESYSCNEITIYWNSVLCFILAGLK